MFNGARQSTIVTMYVMRYFDARSTSLSLSTMEGGHTLLIILRSSNSTRDVKDIVVKIRAPVKQPMNGANKLVSPNMREGPEVPKQTLSTSNMLTADCTMSTIIHALIISLPKYLPSIGECIGLHIDMYLSTLAIVMRKNFMMKGKSNMTLITADIKGGPRYRSFNRWQFPLTDRNNPLMPSAIDMLMYKPRSAGTFLNDGIRQRIKIWKMLKRIHGISTNPLINCLSVELLHSVVLLRHRAIVSLKLSDMTSKKSCYIYTLQRDNHISIFTTC